MCRLNKYTRQKAQKGFFLILFLNKKTMRNGHIYSIAHSKRHHIKGFFFKTKKLIANYFNKASGLKNYRTERKKKTDHSEKEFKTDEKKKKLERHFLIHKFDYRVFCFDQPKRNKNILFFFSSFPFFRRYILVGRWFVMHAVLTTI